MERTAKWLLRNRWTVIAATIVLAIAGAWAWTRLPIDAFPDVTNVQVLILTKAPGLAALDVEQQISFPIEQRMRGLPKVQQVRSLSRAGLSQVVVVFEDDAETYWTRQVVFERLAEARNALPPGIEPELGPISTGLGEIFQYTLESDRHTPLELRTIQDWLVTPRLTPLKGVNEINSFGGFVKQYQVLAHPDRLVKYDLTLADVVAAVERNNAIAGGGVLVRDWEQVVLRGVGLLRDQSDLERIVLKSFEGTPIFLLDVADVVIGAESRQGAVTRDGNGEVVAGMVIMLKGENARDVVERTRAAIARVSPSLPEGVRLSVFYDRTSLIQTCIRTVMDALVEGGLLVVLVLFLFVADLRTALIVLISLPLTFLVTFLVMGWAGISANLMSLGGLAFSVGMVVDASIVMVENIRRHLAAPTDPARSTETVVAAFAEVARPVAFSILIIAIILVPLYSLQGIEGKMFHPLASTMLIALIVSLAVGLTLVPVLGATWLRREPGRDFRFVRRMHDSYLRFLDRAIRWPRTTLAIALVALGGAGTLTPLIGTEFMPPLDEGSIAINVVRLPNASLDGATRVSDALEKRLLRFPEVETVVSKSGRAEISEDPMGPEQTDVIVMLKPRRKWGTGRDKAALVEAIQRDLTQIPGLRLAFSQPIALRVNELISGIKSDLAVKVFGDDLELLKKTADQIATTLRGIDGARDVGVEPTAGMEQLDVEIDRTAAARHGIDVATIQQAIEIGFAGRVASTLFEGQRRFSIVVRLPEERRRWVEDVERLPIVGADGIRVPLAQVAAIRLVEAPAQVSREQGIRRVAVEANIRGRDVGGFVAEARARLADIEAQLPPGTFLEYGGQFENQRRAMRQLSLVVPMALGLILLLLHLALGTFRDSALVLLNLPFALVGGVVAVVVFGMPLSVSAAVAFIVLLGIAVQNGVVLVAFLRQLRGRGLSVTESVRQGCDLRFRPLLMTALTSFIGHLPMLFATGSGADIQKPLAVVVMGGLVTSTLLTLVVLPVLYAWREAGRNHGR